MEYRLYQKGDEEEIVDLLIESYNGWPNFDLSVSPLEHWKWKFLDNPYGALIALSYDGSMIVGCQHILFKKIKVGENVYRSGIGVDVALHPDYRGIGEYGRLSEFKKVQEDSLDLKFRNYLQSLPSLVKRDRKQGNPLFPHGVYDNLRIKRIGEHLSGEGKHIQKWGFSALSSINDIKNKVVYRNNPSHESLNIVYIEEFDINIYNL